MCCIAEATGLAAYTCLETSYKVTPKSDAPLSLDAAKSLVENLAKSDQWKTLDAMEQEVEAHPDSFRELVTNHVFTPGLYMRSVFMAAGSIIFTRIHLTEHPFIISMGRIITWTVEDGCIELCASHQGVTKAGTRRIIYILEDCIFSTCHANPDNETDPDKIVDRLTYNNAELRKKYALQ